MQRSSQRYQQVEPGPWSKAGQGWLQEGGQEKGVVQLRAGGELRQSGVCYGPQASSAAPLRDSCGERQRWECCSSCCIHWRRTREGDSGLQMKPEAIRPCSTHFLGIYNLFAHLNIAQGVAGTGCASLPGLDRAHCYLPVKEGGREWCQDQAKGVWWEP